MKKLVIKISVSFTAAFIFVALCVLTFVDLKSCNIEPRYYSVNYEATKGGRIEGNINQTVQEGKNGEAVTAIPDEGYRFLRWSDTCSPNPKRTDTNVENDLNPQAKFVKISDVKYKILLVHVTEVQATFKDINSNDVVADYKMTEEDLTVCKMTTELFDICLNEMFDGLVTFEIDEYYTKEIMREENFHYSIYNDSVDADLYAQDIPEVADILSNYRSFIANVPLNDPNHVLNSSSGVTNNNTASIRYRLHIPSIILPNGEKVKDYNFINDYSDNNWVSLIQTYVHEFVHTVEGEVTATRRYLYHYVLSEYNKAYTGYDINRYSFTISKLFLLNQAVCDGETVGIPFPVWTNEIYELHYNSNDKSMGTIGSFLSPLRVAKGEDGEEMQAKPLPGYRFVGWSDGITTAKRIDRNILNDMEVIAYFEPNEYMITYLATEGGHIKGNVNQKTYGNIPFETVTAVAEEGYRFIGWDDRPGGDPKFNTRTDSIHAGNVELFESHNRSIVVTAIFEKIN